MDVNLNLGLDSSHLESGLILNKKNYSACSLDHWPSDVRWDLPASPVLDWYQDIREPRCILADVLLLLSVEETSRVRLKKLIHDRIAFALPTTCVDYDRSMDILAWTNYWSAAFQHRIPNCSTVP